MADTRRYLPVQQLDLGQILQEAQHRWLRPTEICEILRNYQRFGLTPEPPTRPPAGSLFLFDRKALRYFRKDGHRWRKKKDGKTVKEAHEKLKAGSVDVLHCYYAHGEDNENFQRRSYWMLDGQLEHIVFVHYREVKEGYKSGISRLLPDGGSQIRGPPNSSDAYFALPTSVLDARASHALITDKVAGSRLTSSDSKDVGSMRGPTPSMRNDPISWTSGGNFDIRTAVSVSTDIHSSNSDIAHDIRSHVGSKFYADRSGVADFIAHKLIDARLDSDCRKLDVTHGNGSVSNSGLQAEAEILQEPSQVELEHDPATVRHQKVASSAVQFERGMDDGLKNEEAGELRKLDSFGRWMDKEIGRDCDDSLMASNSGNYWNALNTGHDDKEVSSLSRHMQLDTDSLGPSLSHEQLFSISEFAPDWAYSNIETKVLIIGTFVGSKKLSGKIGLGCMFGEVEVPAEVLTDTAIKCVAPAHAPGRVPFYVTCSDRLACSEVREFEYRETPSTAAVIGPEEGLLPIRFAKLLSLTPQGQLFNCSVKGCNKCRLKDIFFSMIDAGKGNGERAKEASKCIKADHECRTDATLQSLLMDRLYQWLFLKAHKGGGGPHILDKEGQGVIHLAAALGYEWAIGPIIAAGIKPNFRDSHGRTALHWASYFGREEMVITLVGLGVSPGVVDDPTPTFPGGQTAADLASNQGHKGIAAYLAEADLTSHPCALTVDNDVIANAARIIGVDEMADAALGAIPSDISKDEELIMKGSLAALRKSAHAAALIQSFFRMRSFHQRQLTKAENDAAEVSMDLVALGSLNKVQKISNFEDYLHSAAIKIQQKYRGWKGRKEFLKIRNRIIKVQAHVRGHRVRKQYKKVVWSVGIVEKAILRWRRKRVGLRAFCVEKKDGVTETLGSKADEYDYLRIGRRQKFEGVERALARVKSMVRDPKARDQYMRLVSKSDNLKMISKGNSVLAQVGIEQKTETQ